MRAMKDSGIEWIGSIPEHWEVCRMKNVCTQNPHSLSEKEDKELEFDYVDIGSVSFEKGIFKSEHYAFKDAPSRARRKASLGDLIMSTVRTYLRAIDIVNTEEKANYIYSTGFAVLTPFDNIKYQYLSYISKSQYFLEQVGILSKGINYPSINSTDLMTISIALPTLTKQQAIADYLDEKCAEVDEMIALQEQIIEELKAYKQSVITEAVTKGINPAAPMRDSEIVFVDKIPSHWKETKTLRLLSMPITDGPHETPDGLDDGIPFISADAVSDGYINFDNKWGYISQKYYEECCKKYIPQKYDIYMIKSGASTGRTAIVETDEIFTIWSPLAVFRANTNIILPYFLLYVLRSDYYQKQVENKWSFGTQQNIGMRVLEKLLISYPPITEQQAIADYLNEKCADIDSLIQTKQSKIDSLKEYKKSIIYEYVTGKREVE